MIRPGPGGRSALACAALLSWSAAADAASVRYLSDASEPFNRRVVAEIESVGLEAERPATSDVPLPSDCVALIRVSSTSGTIEVWLADERTLALAAKLERDTRLSDDEDSVRIAEAVRGLLTPVAQREAVTGPLPPPPPPREAAPPESPPAPVPPREEPAPVAPAPQQDFFAAPDQSPAGFAATLGAAALPQPGGVGFAALLALRQRVTGPLALELGGALPFTTSSLTHDGASADVDVRLAFASAYFVAPISDAGEWRVGAGATLFQLRAAGSADAPRQSSDESSTGALPHLAAGGSLTLAGPLALSAGAWIGYAPERTDVIFSAERVAGFGRPFALGFVGFSYQL